MFHLSQRIHAFVHGLFAPKDQIIAREHYDKVNRLLVTRGVGTMNDRQALAMQMAAYVLNAFEDSCAVPDTKTLGLLIERIFDFEDMFLMPSFDWSKPHSISEYWEVKDFLLRQQNWLEEFDETTELIEATIYHCLKAISDASPRLPTTDETGDTITVPTDLIRTISGIGEVTEAALAAV
ncbi:MAG: hypothetical protein GY761_07450, partial [Hyphomicrobiales bacterium]|nr:hypothetical protein [Hyphomicrobiales bacterium]